MNTDRLVNNMMDQVTELQLKLGYARETVRLYYPVSSLQALLGKGLLQAAEKNRIADEEKQKEVYRLLAALNEDPSLQETGLGHLVFSVQDGRIAVSIPPEGTEYVHQNRKASAFLTDLIGLFQKNHHCSLEEICQVFAVHVAGSENSVTDPDSDRQNVGIGYICEKMPPEADFDYVLSFVDPTVDEYYYCIKMEMGHTIYHRFMREDYESLALL